MSRISPTTHSKMVRDIYKNPDIPGDQKRQLIDGLYFNMIEVAKAGKEMAKAAQEKILMKGPSGVEYPIFHVTYPTSDGRWMVAGCKDGKIVMLPDFYQSEEDAKLVSARLNERESERYRTEVIDTVQAKVRFERGHQPGAPEPVMQIGHSKISNPAASSTLADSAKTFDRDDLDDGLRGIRQMILVALDAMDMTADSATYSVTGIIDRVTGKTSIEKLYEGDMGSILTTLTCRPATRLF